MNSFLVTVLALSSALSAFFLYRLFSSKRSAMEKAVYCAVLLVPIAGPLLYLFLSEEVPPQSPLLRNNGPRGAYTDAIIAIQAATKDAVLQKGQAQPDESGLENDDDKRRP